LAKGTNYETLSYAVFANLLSLHPSQISSSAPCSQTPSVCVLHLMSETKFCTRTQPQAKLLFFFCFFLYFNFYNFRQQMRRQQVLNWIVVRISRIQSALNFLMNQILIYYYGSHIFNLCHNFKWSVSCLYVIILPCILVMKHRHILSFLCIYFWTSHIISVS
jgi:hypothetical protein